MKKQLERIRQLEKKLLQEKIISKEEIRTDRQMEKRALKIYYEVRIQYLQHLQKTKGMWWTFDIHATEGEKNEIDKETKNSIDSPNREILEHGVQNQTK